MIADSSRSASPDLTVLARTRRAAALTFANSLTVAAWVLLALACGLGTAGAGAQTLNWAWVGGTQNSNTGAYPVYGTLGTASTANLPGDRYGSMTWTDTNGNFWLFGGAGWDSTGNYGTLNDLWEFSPSTGAWKWVDGSNTVGGYGGQPGVYGTEGTAGAANIPGGRDSGAAWTDSSGNFWLFGGAGYGANVGTSGPISGNLNDLWMYNPTANEWTWEGGSNNPPAVGSGQPGVYGTEGTGSTKNIPGARVAPTTWTDYTGNFWMMGGEGFDSAGILGYLNDLWMYSPTAGTWTWVSGNSSAGSNAGQPGVYGTKGTAAAANVPGGRWGGTAWIAPTKGGLGSLWFFGGYGIDSTGAQGDENDLWMFDTDTNQWTWEGGTNAVGANGGQSGTYGTQGTASTSNVPGGREFGSGWTDGNHNFWMFGGDGFDSTTNSGTLNDFWMYNPTAATWTWVDGSNVANQNGTYGSLDVASASNAPGSRYLPASWTDQSGNFWLYGGIQGSNYLFGEIFLYNDMWEYGVPTLTPPVPQISFNPVATQASPLSFTTASQSQTVTITNTGGATLNFTAPFAFGSGSGFGATPDCSSSLAPGASCTVAVTFAASPVAGTTYTQTIVVTDNAANSPQSIYLCGNTTAGACGASTAPSASLSPNPLAFSTTTVGSTSAALTTTLTNNGTATLTGITASIAGVNPTDFAISANTCGSSLGVSGTCMISVTFMPASATTFNAALSIADNASGSPQTVGLSGTGAAASCTNNPSTPYVNCNPGGSTVITNSLTEHLTFAAPIVTPATASAYSTEIVGKYNGAVVYDQTFAAAYGTPTVQAGVTAANAAVAAAGGAGAVIPSPTLTSSSTNASSASTSLYSVAQPEASTTVTTVTTATTFGPETLDVGGAPTGNPANPTAGQISLCTVASLPSASVPTCMATNPGTFQVNAGQTDINENTDLNYLIDTATTTTTTTTTDAAYAINGTPAVTAPQGSEWIWQGGTSAANSGTTSTGPSPIYGTLGVASVSNLPGDRTGAETFTDPSGNLWLFGGEGFDSTGTYGMLSDLWEYKPSAQTWTWVSGSNLVNQIGVYGTEGTASASNAPGGRINGSAWTDSQGNFWMFGGVGFGATSVNNPGEGWLNDLWKYNPTTNLWTWEGGSTFNVSFGEYPGQPSVFGTQGVPSTSNIPGARSGAATWTDAQGHLWLFGGYGWVFLYQSPNCFFLNDLWMFNPADGTWTWEGTNSQVASQSGVYGSLGTAAAANVPGGRTGPTTWTDASGTLWLFGGSGFDSTGQQGYLNDLWKYVPSTNQWTWVGGHNTVVAIGASLGETGVYGTEGTASASNIPGGRVTGGSWTDSSGNLWLAGGDGFDSAGNLGGLNDLWSYNPTANTWAWVGGSNIANQKGVYGTLNTPAATNILGGRNSSATWTDKSGNFWSYAGLGYDSTGTYGYLNDLWEYGNPVVQVTGPAVTFSPNSLSFSVSTAGTTSTAQTVTMTNSGTAELTGIAASITGTNASNFAISANTCGTSLAANAYCVLSVTFTTPTSGSTGTFAASLSVADNATGSPQTVALSGSDLACQNDPSTPDVNCNPGGTRVVTYSQTEQLTFATPTVTTAAANAFSTEIVGKYNGAVVYDQTFAAAYGTPTVQAGVTAANAAVAAAGGSGAVIASPALTSSSTSTNTASASIYSIAQPEASTTVTTQSTITTFGPATIAAAAGGLGNPANPTAGQVSQCTEASLPSATLPTCMATNAGSFLVIAGQEDLNHNTDSNYLIDTATTSTTTTTTTAAYAINGTPASSTAVAPTVTVMPATSSVTTAQSLSVPVTVSGTIVACSALRQRSALLAARPLVCGGSANGTGTVILSGGGYTSSPLTLTNGSTTFVIPAGALATGTDTLRASYTPDANSSSIFTSATGSAMVSVTTAVVMAPTASLSPTGLSFSAASGTTSASQPVTLSNAGNAALSITSVSITGAGAGSFGETNNCGSSLAAGASCMINVTFTPGSVAGFSASLSVADNAGNSPQAITLSGEGTTNTQPLDFTMTLVGLGSQTIIPGNSTSYQVKVTPLYSSYAGTVNFTIAGLPAGATATFSPASIAANGGTQTVTVTITTAATTAAVKGSPDLSRTLLPVSLALFLLPLAGARRIRRQGKKFGRMLSVVLLLLAGVFAVGAATGCGTSNGYFTHPQQSYTVTITATAGALTHSDAVTLNVQ